MFKNPFQIIRFIITSAFIFFIGAVIVYGDWKEPDDPRGAPYGNVAAPINVGDKLQSKTGPIRVNTAGLTNSIGLAIERGMLGVPEGGILRFWNTAASHLADLKADNLLLDKDLTARNISSRENLNAAGKATVGKDLDVFGNAGVSGSETIGRDLNVGNTATVRDLQANNNINAVQKITGTDISARNSIFAQSVTSANPNSLTVNGQNVCQKDGVNCPAQMVYKRAGTDYCGGTAFICMVGNAPTAVQTWWDRGGVRAWISTLTGPGYPYYHVCSTVLCTQ